ncbi:MAG: radical SAM protein [Clostridia bacterium]|nr:radical SAM protein [Clostridia bacterium]
MSYECERDAGVSSSFARLKKELGVWGGLNHAPISGTLELTPYCNLSCPMCYIHLDPVRAAGQGKHLTGAQWLEILRQAAEIGTFLVTVTGGEPFLHPDFWDIYEGIIRLGILPVIYTNGCLIDEGIVERLKAYPPHSMKISVYGASDETYEAMCGVKKGFTRLSHAIDLLKEAGLPFYTTSTVVRENAHDLCAMYKFAAEKRIPFEHTFAVTGTQRDALSNPHASRIRSSEMVWRLETLEKEIRPATDKAFAFCSGYGTSFHVSWNGRLGYCTFATKPCVPLTDPIDFPAAWRELLRLTGDIRVPPECADCEWFMFCKRCPGLLCSESGEPDQVSPAFCQQAEELYRIYQQKKAEAVG